MVGVLMLTCLHDELLNEHSEEKRKVVAEIDERHHRRKLDLEKDLHMQHDQQEQNFGIGQKLELQDFKEQLSVRKNELADILRN